MGRASRAKRERRENSPASIPDQRPPGSVDDIAMLREAIDMLTRALKADDLFTFVVAMQAVELLRGASVFDVAFGPYVEGATGDDTILDIALSYEALECLDQLLDVGMARGSTNCNIWIGQLQLDFEAMLPNDPRLPFVDLYLNRLYEPTDEEDARQLQRWAIEDFDRPRFAAMARDLSDQFFAAREHDSIELSTPFPSIAARPQAPARRL